MMKSIVGATLPVVLAAPCHVAQAQESATVSAPESGEKTFCLFRGLPPSDLHYSVIRDLKVGKGTYGSVNDILPQFLNQAQAAGADAIVNYTGSQRFGLFPWRFIRPVARGTAIKWESDKPFDCVAVGGLLARNGRLGV